MYKKNIGKLRGARPGQLAIFSIFLSVLPILALPYVVWFLREEAKQQTPEGKWGERFNVQEEGGYTYVGEAKVG